MKACMLFFSGLVLGVTVLVSPAVADTIYSNGPTNGNTDAWTVNFGFVVSDSFPVSANNTDITGVSFAMWLFPGDTLTSAEVSITSYPFGGTSYFDQTVNFTQSNCTSNEYGYDVCKETGSFFGPSLNVGYYWLNLQNASVPSGDPIYWDENSGPSRGRENELPVFANIGTIPSESFTILGNNTCMCGCSAKDCQADSTAPEPDSFVLFGSGGMALLGFLGALRRKLF